MDFRLSVGCSEKKGFGYLCESNTRKMKHLQIFRLICFQQKEEKGSTLPSNIQHTCSTTENQLPHFQRVSCTEGRFKNWHGSSRLQFVPAPTGKKR